MVDLYVYYIINYGYPVEEVDDYYKAEVYARLIIEEFLTMYDVPEEWKERVEQKLQELE